MTAPPTRSWRASRRSVTARPGSIPAAPTVAHTIDEHVPVDGLVACAQALAVVAVRFCGVA